MLAIAGEYQRRIELINASQPIPEMTAVLIQQMPEDSIRD